MTTDLLVTGATGFIGSRVAAAARERPGVRVTSLSRRTRDGGRDAGTVFGDLADPRTLHGGCAGVDVLVHCASRVGGDPESAAAVNDIGTKALVDEAVRAGVRRIVYVSTTAVHGRGPFHGVRPGEAPIAPVSATSRTRAAAERHVLDAGGLVLRPHLVHGEGDRWVIPGLVALLRALSASITGCAAVQSMIDVGTLGRAVVAAALSPRLGPGARYVGHPDPVPVSELLAAVRDQVERAGDGAAVDVPTARARAAGSPRALHHLDMLTVDHWFADDGFWKEVDLRPGEDFATAFARAAPWYRSHLADSPAGTGRPPDRPVGFTAGL